MAELAACAVRSDAYQHRHPFIVGAQEHVIGVDIDHLYRHAAGLWHRLQRVQHVIAQVAVRAGIENEVGQSDAAEVLMRPNMKRALRGRV